MDEEDYKDDYYDDYENEDHQILKDYDEHCEIGCFRAIIYFIIATCFICTMFKQCSDSFTGKAPSYYEYY